MTRMIFTFIMLTFCLVGCSKKSSKSEVHEELEIPVSSIQTKAEEVCKSLRVLGEIKAADSVAVYSKVNGKLVDYVVKNGSEVTKGDLIANVDRDEVGYKYNHAPIYSPISGIVSSLPLNQGSDVRSSTVVGYIMNIDHVTAVFNLPERYRTVVKVGQQVDILIDSLQQSYYQAAISEINPLIDAASHSFTVEVKIDNHQKELVPGMFASGDIILKTFTSSIMLPEEAVIPIQGEWYIYKIASEQAILKKVQIGLRKKGKVQVLDGVEPGEHVIVGGNHKVSDGQKVRSKTL